MDAEDVLGPDHQDDPMTNEDAQFSDHKKEAPNVDCSASGGTEVVIDKRGKVLLWIDIILRNFYFKLHFMHMSINA